MSPTLIPALGLPPEAVQSLQRAFAREVAVRLPRLLDVLREAEGVGGLALVRADATMLAEGCTLLGDAAGARALTHLGELSVAGADPTQRLAAADDAALLLGRWIDHR